MEGLLGGFSAGKKPDSSKDLEKDEREAMGHAYMSLREQNSRHRSWIFECFKEGWRAKGDYSEARLQQVEADQRATKEAHLRLNALYRSSREELAKEQDQVEDLREIIAEKDLLIKISEEHTQHWEDKCAE